MPGNENKTLETLQNMLSSTKKDYKFLSDLVFNEDPDHISTLSGRDLITNVKLDLDDFIKASKKQVKLADFERNVIEREFKKQAEKGLLSFDATEYDCPYIEGKTKFTQKQFDDMRLDLFAKYKYNRKSDFTLNNPKDGDSGPEVVQKQNNPVDVNYFNYSFFDTTKLTISAADFKKEGVRLGELEKDDDYEIDEKKIRDYALILSFNEQIKSSTDELINTIQHCTDSAEKIKNYYDKSIKADPKKGITKDKASFNDTIAKATGLIKGYQDKQPVIEVKELDPKQKADDKNKQADPKQNGKPADNKNKQKEEVKKVLSQSDEILDWQVRYKNGLYQRQGVELQLKELNLSYDAELRKKQANPKHVINPDLEKNRTLLINQIANCNTYLETTKASLDMFCDKINFNEFATKDASKKNFVDGLLLQAEHEFLLENKLEDQNILSEFNNDKNALQINSEKNFFAGKDLNLYRAALVNDLMATEENIPAVQAKLKPYNALISEFALKNYTDLNIYEARKSEIEENSVREEIISTHAQVEYLRELDIQAKVQAEEKRMNVQAVKREDIVNDVNYEKKIGQVIHDPKGAKDEAKRKGNKVTSNQINDRFRKNRDVDSILVHNKELYEGQLSRRQRELVLKFNRTIAEVLPDLTKASNEVSNSKKIISTTLNENNFFAPYEGRENGSGKLFDKMFEPYKKATENLWQLKGDIKKIKSEILSSKQIEEIANGKSKLPINEENLQKIKNSLNYLLSKPEDRNLITDYANSRRDLKEAYLESANAQVYFDHTANSSEYDRALNACDLKFSPKYLNSSRLSEKINEIEEIYKSSGFDLRDNAVQSFSKDPDISRLARNIGLLQGVNNLVVALPHGRDYKYKDTASYGDQVERLTKLRDGLRQHLGRAYPNDNSDEFKNVVGLITDKKTSGKQLNKYLIHDLFDKVQMKKDGDKRRNAYATKLKNDFINKDLKQQCVELAKSYTLAKNNINEFRKRQEDINKGLPEAINSYKSINNEYKGVASQIEQDKLFANYAKKYQNYKNKNIIARMFDFQGRKELEKTRNDLGQKYGLTSSALDIIKYGDKITSSQLRSCIQDSSGIRANLHVIEGAITNNKLYNDIKVLKEYQKFCDKNNFAAKGDIFASFEMDRIKQENIKNGDAKIVSDEKAKLKKEAVDKKANKQKQEPVKNVGKQKEEVDKKVEKQEQINVKKEEVVGQELPKKEGIINNEENHAKVGIGKQIIINELRGGLNSIQINNDNVKKDNREKVVVSESNKQAMQQ